MSKFKNGFLIVLESLKVIKRNPKVLFFPLLSLIFVLIMVVVSSAPLLLHKSGFEKTSVEHWEKALNHCLPMIKEIADQDDPASALKDKGLILYSSGTIGYFLLFYFIMHFGVIFFNTALIKFVVDKLRSQKISVRESLLFSLSRWKLILAWSLIGGLVSASIQALEQKLDFVGRWVMRIIGYSWNLAVFLVLPVLVYENVSVIGGLRRSAQLFKKTWGERITASFATRAFFSTVYFLIWIVGVVIIIKKACASSVTYELLFSGFFFLVGSGVIIGLCSAIITVIMKAILYCYAIEGVVPQNVDKNSMERLWKVGNGKRPDFSDSKN